MNPTMQKIADRVAGLPEGLREEAEADLETYVSDLEAEAEARDADTMQGLKELENGDYITIEEWREHLDQLKVDLRSRYSR